MVVEIARGRFRGTVTLVNEIFSRHDVATAQFLHGKGWREWIYPAFPNGRLDPIEVLKQPRRGDLLLETVEVLMQTLPQRSQVLLRKRFGLEENGALSNYQDISNEQLPIKEVRQEIVRSILYLRNHRQFRQALEFFIRDYPIDKIEGAVAILKKFIQTR